MAENKEANALENKFEILDTNLCKLFKCIDPSGQDKELTSLESIISSNIRTIKNELSMNYRFEPLRAEINEILVLKIININDNYRVEYKEINTSYFKNIDKDLFNQLIQFINDLSLPENVTTIKPPLLKNEYIRVDQVINGTGYAHITFKRYNNIMGKTISSEKLNRLFDFIEELNHETENSNIIEFETKIHDGQFHLRTLGDPVKFALMMESENNENIRCINFDELKGANVKITIEVIDSNAELISE